MERIVFADGTELNEQQIRDKSVADQKASGTVQSSSYAENYVHMAGDGSYTINDHSYGGDIDRFIFADVLQEDVVFSQNIEQDLVITLLDHFTGSQYDLEEFVFSDGLVVGADGLTIV